MPYFCIIAIYCLNWIIRTGDATENAAKNLEEIILSRICYCGKNREFCPEYSPLEVLGNKTMISELDLGSS